MYIQLHDFWFRTYDQLKHVGSANCAPLLPFNLSFQSMDNISVPYFIPQWFIYQKELLELWVDGAKCSKRWGFQLYFSFFTIQSIIHLTYFFYKPAQKINISCLRIQYSFYKGDLNRSLHTTEVELLEIDLDRVKT